MANMNFTVQVRRDRDGDIAAVWCEGFDFATVSCDEQDQVCAHVQKLLISEGYDLSCVRLAVRDVVDGGCLVLWD